MEDPAAWGPWAAPCPIRVDEPSRQKVRSRLKSKMDQRTRERLPALPVLVAAANNRRTSASRRLQAALYELDADLRPRTVGGTYLDLDAAAAAITAVANQGR